jgi:DNA polymerase III subunit delta
MLYILHGADQFRLREELNKIRASMDTDGNLAHNTVRLEARGLSVADLQAACQSASFFAENRLVIIEGLQARFSGARRGRRPVAGKEASNSEIDAFIAVLGDLPPTTTVILVDETSGALNEALSANATVKAFAILKDDRNGRNLTGWAENRIRERGADFHPLALNRLVSLIDGAHLGELANEIDKLATYALGRQVTVADVDELTSSAMETMIWDLTDAVVDGRGDRALGVLQRMNAKDHPPMVLMATLRTQYRRLMLTKSLQLEGVNSAQAIADKLGMRMGYPVEKLMTNASRYPADRLDTAYRKLLEADVNVKTGVLDVDTVLPALIVELTELSRPQRPTAARR